jgi:hypothetical protein
MAFNPKDHFMNLKGKDYLQVMWRLVWFREEKPLWAIDTELIDHDKDKQSAIFSAKIYDENCILKSSATGSECVRDFKDYIEKAETKAIGRALAMLGYGTQFAPELDEEHRIVDSPVEPQKPVEKPVEPIYCDCCGAPVLPYKTDTGKWIQPADHAAGSTRRFNQVLCLDCIAAQKG